MGFLFITALVVAGICAGVGGGLAALVRWAGRESLKTLVLYGMLMASLLPLAAHYQWSREQGGRVVDELKTYVEEGDAPDYTPVDLQRSRMVLARFTWAGPVVLLGLYLLACWTVRRWRLWGTFLPAAAFMVYVLFFNFALLSPLGRHAYEAMFPMMDADKITVWAFVLCGGAQVGLLSYAWIVSTPERPLFG
ncbi:MAG: hypothetical protein BRD53_07115 [Bacteroidetes bacterium SW_7_64_58]|jgi:hypothetical protein|nr:MAG: hypothetical protein BRD53_07115 [Bacteroidetes bacterium SW_7_64_58]